MKTNITQPLLLVCLIFFGLSAYFAPLAIASTSPNQPSINATSNPTDFPGGVISTNTEWDISGSPYRIHGNITIPAGVRLTLDPGVVLQFDSGTGISVYGQLVSTGQPTPTQSVYFTSYRDNSPVSLPTPGIDDGQPGDWAGISFSYGSSGTFSACVIREAANGVNGIIPAIAGANFDRSPVSLNAASDLIVSGNTFNASSLTIQGPNAYDVSVTGNSFSNGSSANFSGYVGSLSLSGNFSGDGNPVNFNFNGLTLSKTSTLIAQSGIHLINSGTSHSEFLDLTKSECKIQHTR